MCLPPTMRTGKKRRKRPTSLEAKFQTVVVSWARSRNLTIWHTPNELVRGPSRGAIMKRQGVLAGVADLIISDRPPLKPTSRGIAIEMKSPKGKPTVEQLDWLRTVESQGWDVCIAYSAEEAIDFLVALGF